MKGFFGVIASLMPEDYSAEYLKKLFSEAEEATTWEIRLDAFGIRLGEGLMSLVWLRDILAKKKVILTLRSEEQGGKCGTIRLFEQWKFWSDLPSQLKTVVVNPATEVYVDWGVDLVRWVQNNGVRPVIPWAKIGASFHDFAAGRSLEGLEKYYHSLRQSKAKAFLKLVTTASDERDYERLLKVSVLHEGDSRPFIFFAMGKAGEESRKTCMASGSAGTYGYLPGRASAAPGQLSIKELLTNRNIRKILDLK